MLYMRQMHAAYGTESTVQQRLDMTHCRFPGYVIKKRTDPEVLGMVSQCVKQCIIRHVIC